MIEVVLEMPISIDGACFPMCAVVQNIARRLRTLVMADLSFFWTVPRPGGRGPISSERNGEQKMRYLFVALWMVLWSATAAVAQVSIGIALPGVSIGFNVPAYPNLVRVPNYPVYYAPRLNANFFFYDGMYWVYQQDNWYASSWYNGPWDFVAPRMVPLFVLRIPVRYYRNPPAYFRGWQRDAPPRWGDHWGNDWAQHRGGWDTWDRRSAPRPAPLPVYQRKYTGDRYPQAERQQDLRSQQYRYQPRDAQVRQYNQERNQRTLDGQSVIQAPSRQQAAPVAPRTQYQQPPRQGAAQREQQAPAARQDNTRQGKGAPQEQGRGQGQEKQRGPDDDRGQGRYK